MAGKGKQLLRQHVALLLVEGETEEEFYHFVTELYCKSKPKKIRNLYGNFSINRRIVEEGLRYAGDNPSKTFDVYVCIDQERTDVPAYNHGFCVKELAKEPRCKKVIPVIAVLMIESLFFIDIDGIYKFLRAQNSRRKPEKFKHFRGHGYHDLGSLFKLFGKRYRKGHKCESFVSTLNLQKIVQNADELRALLDSINQA